MKHRLLVLVLAGASGLMLPGCETGEASVARETPAGAAEALPVEVAWPATKDLAAVLALSAPLGVDREAVIPARVAGEIVEILVEEGERVRAGQPLARLDGERARLAMQKAGADLERADREYRRALSLRDRGLLSAAAFESAESERDALKATFELMRLAWEHTTVRATIEGVVAERYVKVGWRVDEGQPAFRIADVTRLVADLRIPQGELGRIRGGQPVAVTFDALPGERFAAAIARISPTVDPRDGSFRATVYVDNRDGLLAPGMFGRFGIEYEVHPRALVVPSRAVRREDNDDVLYVVQDGAAERRLVRIGIARPDVTEILDGLAAGEAVVVSGQGGLRDGSPVMARNAPQTDG